MNQSERLKALWAKNALIKSELEKNNPTNKTTNLKICSKCNQVVKYFILEQEKICDSCFVEPKKSFWDYYDTEASYGSDSNECLRVARDFYDHRI